MKELKFIGSSLDDLREMPADVRRALGIELMTVQYGGEPSDFKPMKEVGAGAYEIRYRDTNGAFRVINVAKFSDAVYVLHAFPEEDTEDHEGRYRPCGQTLQADRRMSHERERHPHH